MNERYLDKDQLIFSNKNDAPQTADKIYIREQFGFYQRVRRSINVVLLLVFALLPLLRYQGHQAILFDVEQQQFHLFSLTLFPQDLMIFALMFAVAAFGLFYVTRLYGRVWCGFTCPQTVWMLMFNWVERRIEGTHQQSKSLDRQSFSLSKFTKKALKHTAWMFIALLTALVFMSYFVPVERLYVPFVTLQSSGLVVGWVLFFAGCTYINAGFIREKMCQHMCPYSRFQSAMFTDETSLVTYNEVRGESRGMRKRKQEKPEGMGDCVDCNLCVQVCPVGIDIREGLQYECINCGLCVDACNETMDKFSYPRELITFARVKTTNSLKGLFQQHIGYLTTITILMGAMVYWAVAWQNFDVNVIRDRQALYRINQEGNVENTYLFKIRNKAIVHQRFNIELNDGKFALDASNSIIVAPGELATIPAVVSAGDLEANQQYQLQFSITTENDSRPILKNVTFYSGEGGW